MVVVYSVSFRFREGIESRGRVELVGKKKVGSPAGCWLLADIDAATTT